MKSVLPIFALVCGCAVHEAQGHKFSSLQSVAKSVCDVMTEPDPYLGQRIIIKGLYAQGPHRRLLHDRNCPEWDFSVSLSLRTEGDRTAERLVRKSFKKDPTVSVPVIFSGILATRVVMSGCTKSSCHEYSLQNAQLLAASPEADVPRGT